MIPDLPENKIYFTIGEVAALFDVNPSLIRFWEKEFPHFKPRKNNNGVRIFTKKDIALFAKIYDLVKVKGLTLEGARKALSGQTSIFDEFNENNIEISVTTQDSKKSRLNQIIKKLEEIKSNLIELKNEMK